MKRCNIDKINVDASDEDNAITIVSFCGVAAKSLKPLTIIEIGTSAGLLLNLEHFHYHIEQQPPIQFGQFNSPLKIYAKNLGNPLSTLPPLSIASRIGIDLSIVDTQDEEQAL